MADKTKTISETSNSELRELLFRVRLERDCLQLLREIRASATPNPNHPYPDWEKLGPFSTETIVYDGKSIKQMTDKELSDYLDMLRNKSELINVIQNIQRFNTPGDSQNISDSTPYPGIDLDMPIDSLYHVGILGMRWGVRRGRASSGPTGNKLRKSIDDTHEDHAIAKSLTRKGVRNLSTAELKRVNERIQLERTYKSLNPSEFEKGMKAVQTITSVGKAAADVYSVINSPLGKLVIKSLKKTAKKGP